MIQFLCVESKKVIVSEMANHPLGPFPNPQPIIISTAPTDSLLFHQHSTEELNYMLPIRFDHGI